MITVVCEEGRVEKIQLVNRPKHKTLLNTADSKQKVHECDKHTDRQKMWQKEKQTDSQTGQTEIKIDRPTGIKT